MKLNHLFVVCGIAATAFFSVDAAVDQAKINAVMKGEIKEAKASWWGFDAKDSTKALQAAINSKVPRLIIDKQATPWITDQLNAVSDQTLVFEEGAVIQAKRGAFKGIMDSLLKIENVKNVSIIGKGKGGIMRMHKKDYQNRKLYSESEHRHVLWVKLAKNISVENMTLASSGGDGIYVTFVEDIYMKNVICDDNHRQGMSIINGKNILVENCKFINTSGTSPASGLDIEPADAGHSKMENIVFKNCLFANNGRWGVLLAPSRFNSDKCGEMSIRFENCVMKNNKEGEIYGFTRTIYQTDEPAVGKIEFIDCVAQNDHKYDYLRSTVEFGLDLHHEINILLKNLTIKRGGNKEVALRFGFNYPREEGIKPQSTIELDNVKFVDVAGKNMMQVIDYSFSGETEYITGNITDKNGKKIELNEKFLKGVVTKKAPEFSYDYSDRAVKVAAPADGKMEKYPEFIQNQHANFWFYANAGQQVEFELKYTKIRRSRNAGVDLIDTTGKKTGLGVIKPNESKVFKFTADAAGIYKVKMAAEDLHIALAASNVPAGIMLREPNHRVRSSAGTLYFNVPKGAPEFSIRVWGLVFSRYYNGVKVTICNPAGKVVFRTNSAAHGISYTAPEAEAKKGGIWKIVFDQPQAKQHYFYEYNIRMMGVSPYIGLRADRTPSLD